MRIGKINPLGAVNFPGFQEIHDYTASGSESSVSFPVNGDIDKEYLIFIRVMSGGANYFRMRINGDISSNYGYQYVHNGSGSISAGQGAGDAMNSLNTNSGAIQLWHLATPVGYIKACLQNILSTTGTTVIDSMQISAKSWNSIANVTSLDLTLYVGNIPANTRITVLARRSN